MFGCFALAWTQASFGASAVLTGLTCGTSSYGAAGTDSCTVSLNQDVVNNRKIALTSNSNAVKVPASVTVPVGSASVGFTATVLAISGTQTVTLAASSGGVTETYQLQLSGPAPTLGLSATSVTFGAEPVNSITTKAVTLTSTGSAPLTIYAITVGGSGFSWEGINSTPLTLAPGQTATLVLIFDPTTAGVASGVATIIYNGGSTATIALAGQAGTTARRP